MNTLDNGVSEKKDKRGCIKDLVSDIDKESSDVSLELDAKFEGVTIDELPEYLFIRKIKDRIIACLSYRYYKLRSMGESPLFAYTYMESEAYMACEEAARLIKDYRTKHKFYPNRDVLISIPNMKDIEKNLDLNKDCPL